MEIFELLDCKQFLKKEGEAMDVTTLTRMTGATRVTGVTGLTGADEISQKGE